MYRNKEQEEWKIEIRRFEERMENLREELRKERDKSQKKTFKDLVEVSFTGILKLLALSLSFLYKFYTICY